MALTDNLVSYYTLESNGNDSKGSKNMTESNITYVTGKILNAASFNGSTSTMRNGNITLSAGNSPYSMNFWVKLNAEIGSGQWAFASLNPDGTNQDTTYSISYQYNGGTRRLIYEHYYNGPETYHSPSYNTTLGTSNWNMITITYSGSSMSMYLNGTSVVSGGGSGTYGSSGPQTYQKGLTIGSSYVLSAYTQQSNAIIDELGYWDRAITSGEITQLYNGGSGLAYPFSTGTSNFFMFF